MATVRDLIERTVERSGSVRTAEVARRARISRQAAHKHLRLLVESGRLVQRGKGRAARYVPAAAAPSHLHYPRAVLDEAPVWVDCRQRVPAVAALTPEAEPVFQYAFTEMLNNAIDHSESPEVEIAFEPTEAGLAFEILDQGVGVFDRVRREHGYESNLEALQHLSKGKLTTSPERHTGEGIFFTSKIADVFVLESGGLRWTVDNLRDDMAVGSAPARPGTRVRFEASVPPLRTAKEVFDAYTQDFQFSRTRTVVKLFALGVRFLSRSEGRRLLQGLDRFREVVLDFSGVEEVGQGFVDEVFRVWARAHPATVLQPERMSEPVAAMVRRTTV